MLRSRTTDGRGCGSLLWGGEQRGVQNTCWEQEEMNSHSKLYLQPWEEKSMLSASCCVTFYCGKPFLTEIDLHHLWLQNAVKQRIQNCRIKPRPWFQCINNEDSLQTSGSARFFHQQHPQLCSVLRNPPVSPSLAESN